jgi:hypothetical protein
MVPQTVTKMVPENFMAPKQITVEKTIQVHVMSSARVAHLACKRWKRELCMCVPRKVQANVKGE